MLKHFWLIVCFSRFSIAWILTSYWIKLIALCNDFLWIHWWLDRDYPLLSVSQNHSLLIRLLALLVLSLTNSPLTRSVFRLTFVAFLNRIILYPYVNPLLTFFQLTVLDSLFAHSELHPFHCSLVNNKLMSYSRLPSTYYGFTIFSFSIFFWILFDSHFTHSNYGSRSINSIFRLFWSIFHSLLAYWRLAPNAQSQSE